MNKRILGLVLVIVLVFSLVACAPAAEVPAETSAEAVETSEAPASEEPSAEAEPAGDKPLVGFALFDNAMPWATVYSKSVFEEAEKRGYEYKFADAQNDTAKQVSDVEDLLAQGIELLVLTPIEHEAAAPCLEAAKEAGVPVILTGRTAKGEVGVDYVTYIASDFYWEGQEAGKWLAEQSGGKARIVEITGTVGSSAAIERAKGFYDAIAEYPEMEVVVSQTGNFLRADAQKVMENAIQSLGNDGFDAVYTHCDDMTIGAILAMKQAGMTPGKDIYTVSIDGIKEAVQMVVDGDMSCVVTCTPVFGPILFDTIEKYLAGEKLDEFIVNPDKVIDATNAAEELPFAP